MEKRAGGRSEHYSDEPLEIMPNIRGEGKVVISVLNLYERTFVIVSHREFGKIAAFSCHIASGACVIAGWILFFATSRGNAMGRKTNHQFHHEMPESRLPSMGLIISTIWSVIKRAQSPDEAMAAEARLQIGSCYYNSIRRVFRCLLAEQPGSDEKSLDLTHEFMVRKIFADGCPLLRNRERLDRMKVGEDAGMDRRAFRNYLSKALYHFLCSYVHEFRHSSLEGEEIRQERLAKYLPAEVDVDELVRTAMAEELLSQAVQRLEKRDRRLVEVKMSGETWENYASWQGKSANSVSQLWRRRVIPGRRLHRRPPRAATLEYAQADRPGPVAVGASVGPERPGLPFPPHALPPVDFVNFLVTPH